VRAKSLAAAEGSATLSLVCPKAGLQAQSVSAIFVIRGPGLSTPDVAAGERPGKEDALQAKNPDVDVFAFADDGITLIEAASRPALVTKTKAVFDDLVVAFRKVTVELNTKPRCSATTTPRWVCTQA
jgi:hypothetical protein